MQKLKTRAQFQAVLAGGVVSRTEHFALHQCALVGQSVALEVFPPSTNRPDKSGGQWIGVLVPKRWARRAVMRNTIRRQVYAVLVSCSLGLGDLAWVIRLRRGFDGNAFVSACSKSLKSAVRDEVEALLARVRPRTARESSCAAR